MHHLSDPSAGSVMATQAMRMRGKGFGPSYHAPTLAPRTSRLNCHSAAEREEYLRRRMRAY